MILYMSLYCLSLALVNQKNLPHPRLSYNMWAVAKPSGRLCLGRGPKQSSQRTSATVAGYSEPGLWSSRRIRRIFGIDMLWKSRHLGRTKPKDIEEWFSHLHTYMALTKCASALLSLQGEPCTRKATQHLQRNNKNMERISRKSENLTFWGLSVTLRLATPSSSSGECAAVAAPPEMQIMAIVA